MSSFYLHCVSKEGHKASTAMPSRGLHSYRKVGLMQINTPVKTLAHNDGVDQRAPLLASKSPPHPPPDCAVLRCSGAPPRRCSQALPCICRKLLRPHRSAEATQSPVIRPTRLAVIADHWPNGTYAFIAVGAGAAGRCELFHGGHDQ